jgi:5'-deoxynucleotidase YfbR-like HD superfamily hydrolase
MSATWIITATGRIVHPLDLRPEEIAIEDIAAALSKQCRFTGHTRALYTVGQHSIEVSKRAAIIHATECVSPRCIASQGEAGETLIALWGLLHDASEAYVADVSSPVKHDPRFAAYRDIEYSIMHALAVRFELPTVGLPPCVKEADARMLATEYRDLMPQRIEWQPSGAFEDEIIPFHPQYVQMAFLDRFMTLNEKRKRAAA